MIARGRAARIVVAAALAAVVVALAWGEVSARAARAAAEGVEWVDDDVEPARAALASALLEIEASCDDAAREALRRTEGESDRAAIFDALARVPLAPGAGLHVEDRDGRLLAWAGATIDDATRAQIPRGSDGTTFVETPASRRLAVRRTRATPLDGVPVLAVCHRPIQVRFPLRNRFLKPWSLEEEISRGWRVGTARVLGPDAAEGEPLRSVGGTLARIDVRPLSARSWIEAVDGAAGRRRAVLLSTGAAIAALLALLLASSLRAPRWVPPLAQAGLVLAARAAAAAFATSTLFGDGPLTDPARYAQTLPLRLADSPLGLLLTCGAAAGAAVFVRRALLLAGRRPRSFAVAAATTAAAAVASSLVVAPVVAAVVKYSRVEFFPVSSVLPGIAAAALLAALLACGVAAVLLVDAVWRLARPAEPLTGPKAVVFVVALGALALPLAPAGAAYAPGLALVGVAGAAAAFASLMLGGGAAVRAAVVPLGVTLALFAPLERHLHAADREAVEDMADARASSTDAAARLLVQQTLEKLATSETLQEGLRGRSLPRDLAVRLWADTPLARRKGGSSLAIAPLSGGGQRFDAGLPPTIWLPHPDDHPALGQVSQPLAGRGPGLSGRWIVGRAEVSVDGRAAAIAQAILEVRPPAGPLPELEVLGPAGADDAREPPEASVSDYGPDGRLVGSDAPYRPAGQQLGTQVRRAVLEERRSVWSEVHAADRDIAVLVVPAVDDDGAVTGARAFSFDTGGARDVLLRAARASLCGAIVSLVALLAAAPAWARRVRFGLAQKLVVSYVVVSAVPLLVLAWANRELILRSAEEAKERELRDALALVEAALYVREDRFAGVRDSDAATRARVAGELVREAAYGVGHHANVFLGAELLASSDPALFDTELLPTRLPGPVYRDVLLRGHPFAVDEAAVGEYRFDVGYAPLRGRRRGAPGSASGGNPEGEDDAVDATVDAPFGAVSVPLLQQQRARDRELADAVTAVLGFYLASLVAAIAAGTWLARRLTAPLGELSEATRRVAKGDLSKPVPGAGPDELGEVVTGFNQMMRDLAESRERLVRAQKEAAWRDMARQVAHEVKNPLTPMRLAAEHMRRAWRDKVPTFEAVLERGVDLIVRQTVSLERIATAFSDFARLPVRRRERVDLPALVDEVLDLYANVPDLEVKRDMDRTVPALLGDPDELRRVLVNLARNAVEALDGRAGTLTVRLVRDGPHLVLTVHDTGPGIPDDVKPRLFEPYLSTKTGGTGLGLAICKRAVEDLGGTIGIESTEGEGTTVTIRLES